MVWPSRESPTAAFSQRVVRPKSVIKLVSESVSIRRACAYISRRFTSVFWRGFFFETQSAFLIGLESAEGYPLAVDDSPKTREIPQNNPNHDVFMGTLPSSRRGKRVTLFGGASRLPIYERKVRGMLMQPVSSQPGLVRGTVALQEKSVTVRITEQHKWMEVITQQLDVLNRIEQDAARWQALSNDTLVGLRLSKPIR
ncbi:hypothetical protein TNCV_786381 [Trichonephila clavipes]|nr:hypothetical protein TNCV_786381 [Trichonephila clavipes]